MRWREPVIRDAVLVACSATRGNGFRVVSYGADGTPGGAGLNADIELRDGNLVEERRMNEDERAEAIEAPYGSLQPGFLARLAAAQ